jgi:hypothetical protein
MRALLLYSWWLCEVAKFRKPEYAFNAFSYLFLKMCVFLRFLFHSILFLSLLFCKYMGLFLNMQKNDYFCVING